MGVGFSYPKSALNIKYFIQDSGHFLNQSGDAFSLSFIGIILHLELFA